MDLTPELKQKIDNMNIYDLLSKWRFALVGDPIFQGESGEYWSKRMHELREQDPELYTKVSKQLW
ncbi:MAG: hypothetical protein JHC33_14570 [Ignisphaera sp.]|nr:hypothetical protein [Ignisphaera sp.]